MLKCNYCNRILKTKYQTCPGCGSSSFEEIKNMDNYIINTPPEGGYKIPLGTQPRENNKKDIKNKLIITRIILIFAILGIVLSIKFLPFRESFLVIIFLIFLIFYIFFNATMTKDNEDQKREEEKQKKNYEKLKKLSTKGILIKNIDYTLETAKLSSKKKQLYNIRINYVAPNGNKIILTDKVLYNMNTLKDDAKVDLLIDPDDFSNYYIDFEIY